MSKNDEEDLSQETKINFKAETDLFKEESYVPQKIIRIKRKQTKSSGESWEVFVDNKSVLVMKGNRFNNKEKDFLRTAEGITFLLAAYKSGLTSVVKIKKALLTKIQW